MSKETISELIKLIIAGDEKTVKEILSQIQAKKTVTDIKNSTVSAYFSCNKKSFKVKEEITDSSRDYIELLLGKINQTLKTELYPEEVCVDIYYESYFPPVKHKLIGELRLKQIWATGEIAVDKVKAALTFERQ